MTFDGSGNALVVWAQDDSFRFNAWANGFVVGSGWGTPQLIESSDDVRQAMQISLQATDDLRDG